MLEFAVIFFFVSIIGDLAEDKGRNRIMFQILFILAYLLLEITLLVTLIISTVGLPGQAGYHGLAPGTLGILYLVSFLTCLVIMAATFWAIRQWMPEKSRIRTGEYQCVLREASVYTEMDSRSSSIATLASGDKVEALTAGKIGGVQWIGIKLPDGEQGFILGDKVKRK